MEKKIGTVQLPQETINILKVLAKADQRSMSSYLRVLIAAKAHDAGIL
jgi:predicted DNA-binding protein